MSDSTQDPASRGPRPQRSNYYRNYRKNRQSHANGPRESHQHLDIEGSTPLDGQITTLSTSSRLNLDQRFDLPGSSHTQPTSDPTQYGNPQASEFRLNHKRVDINRHNRRNNSSRPNRRGPAHSTDFTSNSQKENNPDHHNRSFPSRGRRINFRYTRQPNDGETAEIRSTEETSADQDEHRDEAKIEGQCNIAENQFRANNFECLICCDNILRHQSIWSCSNCYNIFHLKCAIEWCNKSIKSRNDALAQAQYPSLGLSGPTNESNITSYNPRAGPSNTNLDKKRQASVEWPCPTCRELLHAKPNKYTCFCGKVTNPEVNRLLTPHSCGQVCGRKRPNQSCPHNCNSLCHPGRCQPCNLTSQRSCFCGKLNRQTRCSDPDESCKQVCEKVLACGVHVCKKVCHEGSCETCDEELVISCNCGRQQTIKRCLDINSGNQKSKFNFSCEQVCGNRLDCKNHSCNRKCHPKGACQSCDLLSKNITTCPCGSTRIAASMLEKRTSCLDPVPTCNSKCNQTLICGPDKSRHKCQKKCHVGYCPPCKLKMSLVCECKLSTKNIECSLMFEKVEDGDRVFFKQRRYAFFCETRCNTPKNCSRHRCNNKCCQYLKDFNLHKCDQICNRKLQCGKHSCNEPCHPGQCGDCPNIGWQELTCHCGSSVMYPPIPCGARPPTCQRPCRRAHHCGHQVKHECHDDTEKCPPCTVFVKKLCFCGADSKDSVYCYLPGYSCGRNCKKPLACGQHQCKKVCHDNECETANQGGLIACTQLCPTSRYQCKHPCALPCHGKTPCPNSECKKIIEISCRCGNRKEKIECAKVMREVDNRNKLAMMSTNRSNQDSIMVDLSRNIAPKDTIDIDPANAKTLDCDDNCTIMERNKALAEALDIAEPNLKPSIMLGQDPLKLLKEATSQDYKFVSSTFNSLAKFVKAAKDSEKRFTFIQFPAPDKLKREIIHEIAQHFHCTSETRGEDPFKVVVVRAYKNKSCIPDFTIEELLPVSE